MLLRRRSIYHRFPGVHLDPSGDSSHHFDHYGCRSLAVLGYYTGERWLAICQKQAIRTVCKLGLRNHDLSHFVHRPPIAMAACAPRGTSNFRRRWSKMAGAPPGSDQGHSYKRAMGRCVREPSIGRYSQSQMKLFRSDHSATVLLHFRRARRDIRDMAGMAVSTCSTSRRPGRCTVPSSSGL